MKRIIIYALLGIISSLKSMGQIDPQKPIMLNDTDSLPYHTIPVSMSDTFSVIEIREIQMPSVRNYHIKGKRIKILSGDVIPECRNWKFFFRRNQIYFIRLKRENTVYGIISITDKRRDNDIQEKNIILNNSYFFTIIPYNEQNNIPNEKVYYIFQHKYITFKINSQNLFIENIYTTNDLDGLKYIDNQ